MQYLIWIQLIWHIGGLFEDLTKIKNSVGSKKACKITKHVMAIRVQTSFDVNGFLKFVSIYFWNRLHCTSTHNKCFLREMS